MKRYPLISLLFAGLVVLPVQAQSAQDGGLDPDLAITQYVHDVWEAEDGLPQNSVSSIAQTPDGYLWIGTQEGLVRFDGVKFTVYSAENHDAFEVSDIISLSVAEDSTLWVATRGGGLVSYSHGRFDKAGQGDENVPRTTTSVFVDGQGRTWAGTYGRGLMSVEQDSIRVFHELAGFDGRFISAVRQDQGGRLWVGSDRGLFGFENERFVPTDHPELEGTFVTSLHADPDGTLWIGTRDERLFSMTGSTLTDHTAWLAGAPGLVKSVTRDRRGTLWIARLGGGITRVRGQRVDRFTVQDGLSDDQVTSVFEDREGSIWFGTAGGGLNRLRQGKFVPLTVKEGLQHDNVFSVIEGPDGIIWVASERGVTGFENGRPIEAIDASHGLDVEHVQSLAVDHRGRLWIGTAGAGVYVRHGDGSLSQWTSASGLTGDVIFALFADSSERMWVGTDAGVSVFSGDTPRSLTTENGLSSDFPTYFAEDSRGGVWIGTYDGGVNYFTENAVRDTLTVEDGLATNEVLALHVDDSDRLWIGSYGGGLNVVDAGAVLHLDASRGLFNDKVLSLVPDGLGNMWMSSNRGISRVAIDEVLALAQDSTASIQATTFRVADGLDPEEANGGQQPAVWKASSGALWFPTVHGAVRIDPADYPRNDFPPPVVVEHVDVDGASKNPWTTVQLQPGSDRITVTYSATSLIASENTRFRYRLKGYRGDWSALTSRREAVYTNLDPGWYTFEVEAVGHDGVVSARTAELHFQLLPHFWQTAWFKALALLLAVAALGGVFQLRVEQHRRRAAYLESQVDLRTRELREEKERTERAKDVIEAQANKLKELDHFKTRFFANVSHEFRTPLTMIIGPLENALGGAYGSLAAPVSRQMDIMLRNARRLMRLINQLLDLSKLEAGKMSLKAGARNIVSFLQGVLLTIEPFADKKGLELKFSTSADDVQIFFEPDKLEKVFYNLLSNASKFTPTGGSIGIDVSTHAADDSYPDGRAEINVHDTGKGIPPENLPHIFDRFHQVDGSNTREHEGTGIGLSLVKEMVELHGGEVVVESEVGVGTAFRIVLPLGSSHLKEEQIVEAGGELVRELNVVGAQAELESTAMDAPQSSGQEMPQAPDDAPLLLIVDDNADVREYIGSIVSPHYRTVFAEDGVAGLEVAGRETPDLIISDIMMPRMDGNELCRRVKSDPDLSHTPVILVSARATQEVKIEGLEVGADDYVPKPFNAEELLARVRNLLKLRHHEKRLKELNENLEDVIQDQLTTILSEREKYEGELIQARDRAETSARLKTAILDNMNHEFRTPLTIILASAQMLKEDVADEHRSFLEDIQSGTERLQRTLEAVSELSSISAEQRPELKRTDLTAIMRRSSDRISRRASKKNVAVRVRTPRDRTADAVTSEAHIQRILDALVDNAVKFTDSGEILLAAQQAGDEIRVVVQDSGCGMSPEFLERAMEAFAQESSGLARTHEGFGLGLTVAQRISELIGCQLHLESTQGEGTTAVLRIPARRKPIAPKPSGKTESSDQDNGAAV